MVGNYAIHSTKIDLKMKHRGDTDNIFDPHLHHLFEKVNQFDCLINVRPESQRSFVLSPSLIRSVYCLLCRYSIFCLLLPYAIENDNYFVMHSSSLHLHDQSTLSSIISHACYTFNFWSLCSLTVSQYLLIHRSTREACAHIRSKIHTLAPLPIPLHFVTTS